MGFKNPQDVRHFIDTLDEYEKCHETVADLETALAKFHAQKSEVSKDELKEVFVMLKDRELHPSGHFDKAGRFWLDDSELVNVRDPSTKYPYAQMNAGRSAKFVRAIADKYACKNKDDLIARFKKAESTNKLGVRVLLNYGE